jgi:hypothetical protein
MTLWDAYLILLSRFGLARRPTAADGGQLELPSLDSLRPTLIQRPSLRPIDLAQSLNAGRWLALPLAFTFALAGQWSLLENRDDPGPGLGLLAVGILLFVVVIGRESLDLRPVKAEAATTRQRTLVERADLLLSGK